MFALLANSLQCRKSKSLISNRLHFSLTFPLKKTHEIHIFFIILAVTLNAPLSMLLSPQVSEFENVKSIFDENVVSLSLEETVA